MKHLMILTVTACCLSVAACGGKNKSDSKDSDYSGYMPRFSSSYISQSPQTPTAVVRQTAQAQNEQPTSEVQTNTIEIAPIDCTESTAIFNAAPQANNFNNSAVDFIRNLQAQTNSYDCIMRQQVFERRAEVSEQNNLTTVVSNSTSNNRDEYASWEIPTSFANKSGDTELAMNARGILINNYDGKSRTRIDLTQSKDSSGIFAKIIRTTLLTYSEDNTDIRSSIIMEIRDSSGKLVSQRVGGRIIFDNKVSVVAASIVPNQGAISYLKQCDETTAANNNDYTRECTGNWQALAYDSNWDLQTDVNEIASLLSTMNLTSEGTSVMDEVEFFYGQSENEFFSSKTLPPALETN